MVWIIIGGIVCMAIIINILFDKWNDLTDKFFYSFMAILLSVLITAFVLFLASGTTSSVTEIEYDIASDTKIIALKDNQNVNGNFYIFGGYVDEDLYYYYAYETEFGYKTEKLKADNAYIKYTDEEPHIERYVGDFANEGAYFWGVPMCDDRYIIYVPEGTVTNEFNVDLE